MDINNYSNHDIANLPGADPIPHTPHSETGTGPATTPLTAEDERTAATAKLARRAGYETESGRERLLRRIKLGTAGVLLCLMLVMTGLSMGYLGSGSLSSVIEAPAQTTVQSDTGTSTLEIPPSEEVVSSEAAPQAQVAVLDARSAVAEVGPAVVTILNTQSVTTGRGRYIGTATAVGSGVIIDSRGYIITNNHVVENQRSLEVIFSDGSKAQARLVAGDESTDLAIIKVDVSVPSVAEFGNSDALEPGQPAIAIGTALGDFRNTVTAGVVSALDRDLDASFGEQALHDLIQTDASINSGNSGGPLLDVNGYVIGINVAVVRGSGMPGAVAEGLGFAIPSNVAKAYADQITGADSASDQ